MCCNPPPYKHVGELSESSHVDSFYTKLMLYGDEVLHLKILLPRVDVQVDFNVCVHVLYTLRP